MTRKWRKSRKNTLCGKGARRGKIELQRNQGTATETTVENLTKEENKVIKEKENIVRGTVDKKKNVQWFIE